MTHSTDMNDILRPHWLAVSALVFGRIDSLRPSGADKPTAVSPGDLMPRLLAATEPRDMSREEFDAWIEDDAGGAAPTFPLPAGPDPLPGPRRVGLRTRLALLRLCAGLGEVTRLTRIAKPGTVTVIEGVPTSSVNAVLALFHDEILGLAHSLSGGVRAQTSADGAKTVVLSPRLSDGVVPPTELARFEATFADALENPAPLVVLLPAGLVPPQSLQAAAPVRIVLAPLDRAVLLQLWAATHPAQVKACARAIIARLPADECLARLTDIELLAALRLGDPRRAAAELTARSARAPGPRLADLPASPAVAAARGLVADLAAWRDGTVAWDDIPHSLLLYGPPGSGKTYIAKAMAGEPGLRCVSASFAAWQATGHLGDMLKAMQASFAEALALAPCILFIDEIDSAGTRSGGDSHGAGYRRQVVNAFLLATDQLNAAGGVMLVGACNDPGALDPSILRPGRFDSRVEVPLPQRPAIAAVLSRQLGTAFTAAEIDQLSRRLIGESLATVDAVIRGARSDARAAKRPPGLADLEARLPGSAPDPGLVWRIAVHEAGHAIVAHGVRQGRVTRVSLGRGGGLMERMLEDSEPLEAAFNDHLAVHLAGRAAERVMLGTVSAGSGGSQESDLAQATRLALMIETRSGLGASGPLWLEQADPRDTALHDRIRKRLEAAEDRAAEIIHRHRTGMLALAAALMAEGELSGARLDGLLADPEGPDPENLLNPVPSSCPQDRPEAC